MEPRPDGIYETRVEAIAAGARYWFKIDGAGPFPDPASRYQPEGVHRPSALLGATGFSWPSSKFQAPGPREMVIYELHVGAFTPEGTFLAAAEKLDYLHDLGVNVVELMPIAEFAGSRNWGYDGVLPYAPSHVYGTPDDLRHLIREAHARGMAVCLDVVYNHLGPDGAYQSTFAPRYYSGKHKTPWGDGLNFDSAESDKVRTYFVESAIAWIQDYRVDGFRVDATHSIQDDSDPPFLAELTERTHAAARELGREMFIIAEDERNLRQMVLPPEEKGLGFDAVWSDDFHHHMRHRLAGDSDGYYQDFDGTAESIAKTVREGWSFSGNFSRYAGHVRGTSAEGLSLSSRVFCLQNHDQIGNRAFGERLSTQISPAAFRAASALLLLAPEIPLLFMGQEWAAPEPFLYFTDHNPELGRLVTEGRRKEFARFSAFANEEAREKIPDPQAPETFLRSKLNWAERGAPERACLRWYQKLLQIRSQLLREAEFHASAPLDDSAVSLEWRGGETRLIAVIALEAYEVQSRDWENLRLEISSEDGPYAVDSEPLSWDADAGRLKFRRAGAAVLMRSNSISRNGEE
jgi:maltooligosyltrehalose trehalohydrolase